ncbi:uncharacterized protein KY384_004346 [Bacidia gigantensis]|uniref:uncharacterized protein n=1 Tax=Bacidia gigantensis TaxID=2732470 RepID=UPI001D048757|nr:uncharacterized protein KY384_004346 [Bacidia gigantensis]KAG8530989.1 hypothetical protein KY384_004346 [Bacidia gigantensis]
MTSYCQLTKNADHEYECYGCENVGTLFVKKTELERTTNSNARKLRCKVHNDFHELERCARKCATCRVFQRALWLRQFTKQEADMLAVSGLQDPIWAQLSIPSAGVVSIFPKTSGGKTDQIGGTSESVLTIEIGTTSQPQKSAIVRISSNQGSVPTNLRPEGSSEFVLREARGWFKNCDKNHAKCKNLSWSRRNPSYLVKVEPGSGDLQLVKTAGEDRLEYAALSYCWGLDLAVDEVESTKIEASKTLRGHQNNEGNLDQRLRAFSASSLPETIRDAIKLTECLKIPYIWVDAVCIPQDTDDWYEEASRMHEVYGNAAVTLSICSSEKSVDDVLGYRKAWQYRRDSCRLYSGHWLANVDTTLDEVRLRSRLFTRAWTLQEERLSPRILYVSGQRMYWSCLHSQSIESGGHRGQLELPNRSRWLRHPQEFLDTRFRGDIASIQIQWLELVKTYAKRFITRNEDRFPAMAGLAIQYLEPFVENGKVVKEEYLAGLWRQSFLQGLTWSIEVAKEPEQNLWSIAPSWSWASTPPGSDIETQHPNEPIETFKLLERTRLGQDGQNDDSLEIVTRGASIKSVRVFGQVRRLLHEQSIRIPWEAVQRKLSRKDEFDFSDCISYFVHSKHSTTGQLLAYEPRKQEIVCKLDYMFVEDGVESRCRMSEDDMKEISCLQTGESSMLLLMKVRETEQEHVGVEAEEQEPVWMYRRVGVCNTVRNLFFASAVGESLILV